MKSDGKIPVRKNDDITLSIEGLTGEGQGVGRVEGFAVFVIGALFGETVRAHVIKVEKSYAVAKLVEVLTPSPDRVAPRCPVFAQCGGCTLQHLSYPAQRRAKQQQVIDALTRLGGLNDVTVRPILGMDEPWRYRNKGSFPVGSVAGAAVFGFYAERSHRLVALSDCPIQDERIVEIAARTCAWANEHGVSIYDESTQRGNLRHIVARALSTGETMATIVTRGPLKHRDALIEALEGVDSVWHNLNPADTNVIFGETFTLLAGKETLTEQIGDNRFRVSPQSFLQVNARQTAALYEAAVELLSPHPNDTVVDAYCGIGTISLMLSSRVKRVIGIEQVRAAIDDATGNAAANGVENATFLCGDTEDVLPELLQKGERVDAVVLDPPRKGCDERALAAIADAGIQRIAYVSCNPATLARDCKYLAARGYRLVCAQPVDMFPQTSHVECVALLCKEEIDVSAEGDMASADTVKKR